MNRMSEEIWKDIEGYEGYYQISNIGRVKSLSRLITKNLGLKGIMKFYSKEKIKTAFISRGYVRVALCKNGIPKKQSIHRLIAKAFIPKVDGKEFVNHIDSNRSNNSISNLEWCTSSENNSHAYKYGNNNIGEKHGRSKFSDEIVNKIRSEYVYGSKEFGSRNLAKKYGMTKTNVLDIVNNKIRKRYCA